ncbi:MAG: hypothetical protein ROO76_12170 [Terriglobia bacterium]|nr:hypothetical protein [Terriglobia bacterium]
MHVLLRAGEAPALQSRYWTEGEAAGKTNGPLCSIASAGQELGMISLYPQACADTIAAW